MLAREGLLWALALVAGCQPAEPVHAELSVAAAASLRQLLEASHADFVNGRADGVELSFTFAGSSTLARQIAAGAAVDVFVSADPLVLERAGGRAREEDARPVLGNRLALIARAGAAAVAAPADLTRVPGSIAVAAAAVPAGRYARRLLAEQGLAETLAPRLVSADHVRAALALVESAAADYGIVYATDAALAREARTEWTGRLESGAPITYVAVALADAAHPTLANDYLDFLSGADFRQRARELGFLIP